MTDLFARDLEPREHLAIFQSVLLGLIEASPPAAIHWRPAGKLVDPAALLRASGSARYDDLPASAINVRLFRVKNSEDGDLLMDTLGLAALMLPDLQIHFHGLEPASVAAHLYAFGLHVLRHGDVLDDGDARGRPPAGQTWTCWHAPASLVEPTRPVIDLDPGPPYAGRHEGDLRVASAEANALGDLCAIPFSRPRPALILVLLSMVRSRISGVYSPL